MLKFRVRKQLENQSFEDFIGSVVVKKYSYLLSQIVRDELIYCIMLIAPLVFS